ncbi:MAG TPA: hypothetical protein VKE74_22005 [Gemmataceae bacterium]|nr:hypothetical protein [Gemmataceae bacterium]
MATLFPRPAAPGAVSAAELDAVRELHAVSRRWAESVPVHLPYLDLTFAFGFALLGDAGTSRRLLADAWAVMQFPVPPPAEETERYDPVTAALVPPFAYRAFEYRIGQALAGHRSNGTLPAEVLATMDELRQEPDTYAQRAPQMRALYVIDRLREQSSVVDPDEQIDPYLSWTKHGDPVKREFADLRAVEDRAEFTNRLRRLCEVHIRGEKLADKRTVALRGALNMAARADGVLAAELVGLALEELTNATADMSCGGNPVTVQIRSWDLERALFVAAHIGRADLTRGLAELFGELANRFPPESRFRLIGTVGTQCLRSLRALGLREEIERLVARLRIAIGDHPPDPHNPESVTAFLRSRLILAAGLHLLGSDAEAAPLLNDARQSLLGPDAPTFQYYTDVARAYVSALGEGSAGTGMPRVVGLFREMPPERIRNIFTTAVYFSRWHLTLTEEAVAAVCRMLLEPPLQRVS